MGACRPQVAFRCCKSQGASRAAANPFPFPPGKRQQPGAGHFVRSSLLRECAERRPFSLRVGWGESRLLEPDKRDCEVPATFMSFRETGRNFF